ncbi:MAG: iron ABC transporter permease [Roseovarius sp.]|nr:iron ABC transporter permease [Roseovarius sp.]
MTETTAGVGTVPGATENGNAPASGGKPNSASRRMWMSARTFLLGLVSVPAGMIVGLVAIVMYVSFRENGRPSAPLTLQNYPVLFADPAAWSAFRNTLVFTVVTLIVAALFALPMAWLVERTDFGHRKLIYALMVVKVIMPGFLTAMGWIFMFHPRIGTLNHLASSWFGIEGPLINISSVPGMGWVQGLGLTSVMFIMTSASFRNIDSSLEESARMNGATTLQTLRYVTLPLAWPGTLGALLYTAAIAIAVFDIPLIIGFADRTFLFSTFLYLRVNPIEDLPQYGVSGAASSFMIVLAIAASWWYTSTIKKAQKYEVVKGKGYQPKVTSLGKWRPLAWVFIGGYMVLSLVIPLLLLVFVSTQPYVRPPTLETLSTANLDAYRNLPMNAVMRGIQASALMIVIVPTVAMVISALFAWTVLRSRARFRMAYDYIAFLPQAVPNVIFALGALIIALNWTSGWYDLYRTLTLTMIVLVLLNVSFGSRVLNAAIIQIHPELEEAAQVQGAGTFQTFRRVLFPLIKPTFVFGWLWLAILTFRELTIPTFLSSSGNAPLPVIAWQLWSSGRTASAAALTTLMFVFMVPLAMLYLKFAKIEQ